MRASLADKIQVYTLDVESVIKIIRETWHRDRQSPASMSHLSAWEEDSQTFFKKQCTLLTYLLHEFKTFMHHFASIDGHAKRKEYLFVAMFLDIYYE